MKKYFVGFTLPKSLADEVDELRLKFSPHLVSRHPPHLTVVEPFSLDELNNQRIADGESLANEISRVYLDRHPFHLKIIGLGKFDGERQRHLEVEASPALTSFQDKLLDVIGLKSKHAFYKPHISLGKLPDDVAGEAEVKFKDLEFEPAGLQIFNKSDEEIKWKSIEVTF